MHVELFDIHDRERLAQAFAVRLRVFVNEQHVPADEEVDEHDRTDVDARHALVRIAGAAVATGRSYRTGAGTAHVGRMAVLAPYRGRRLGRAVLDALIADARAHGCTRVVLHAQDHAVAFYEKAGFIAFGATFLECKIVHQSMELAL